MKMTFRMVVGVIALSTATIISQRLANAEDEVPAVIEWRGILEDPRLLKAKPGSGIINDQLSLKRLWSAWSMGPVPAIDFSRHLAVVAADHGGHFQCRLIRDDAGHAKMSAAAETKAIGVSFIVMVVSRADLKSIDGQELTAGKALDHADATEIRVKRSDVPGTGGIGPLSTDQRALTTEEAAKEAGSGKRITVEFTVKSALPLPPDSKQVRLLSELDYKSERTFVVHLSADAVGDSSQQDLESKFVGKRIRVSGKVETMQFGTPHARPGIRIEVLDNVWRVSDSQN